MGHFGAKKTEQVLADHFFWTDVKRCGEIRTTLRNLPQS
jgi:hypothetical protein